ncbi:hypothetical protein CPB85DRAFT_1325718 [Mucidula mucida]|nr:hypothetical protein CPB85DRAFT_1325718 [Mucidula mucida]
MISELILPIAAEAVIWRSTFGHSIIGQSYLHTTTHQPTSTEEETRDVVRNALSVPPSATASTESGVLFRILRTQFASYLADMISTMLPRLSSGDESQRDQQPSPEDNSKKRKFWFPQVASMKRRKRRRRNAMSRQSRPEQEQHKEWRFSDLWSSCGKRDIIPVRGSGDEVSLSICLGFLGQLAHRTAID